MAATAEIAFHEHATEEQKQAYRKVVEDDNIRVKEIIQLANTDPPIPRTLRDFFIVRGRPTKEAKQAFVDWQQGKYIDKETGTAWFNSTAA